MHMPSKPAFDEKMRDLINQSMEATSVSHHKEGTIVVIEGPRFSTLAESKMFQMLGGHTIGMTTCPEAHLAKVHYFAGVSLIISVTLFEIYCIIQFV